MAQFPCSAHGGRYYGAQQTVYPAIVSGAFAVRERQRLCPECYGAVMDWVEANLRPSLSADTSATCCVCESFDAPYAVFVTAYGRGREREDWYGRACGPHAASDVAPLLFGHAVDLQQGLGLPDDTSWPNVA